ncbi:MAG: phosphatase PAP2 family protein [bacterium]|nr:phosphatase PAP2 family protein [bacterium]MDZ4284935.1 phosphatase PAP2 family protein [Patescibacteria group bacterium]
MNTALFLLLHSFADRSAALDAFIVFVADYLAFIFFFALLAYEGWQWMKGRRARARELLRAIGIAGLAWIIAEAVKFFVASPRPFLVIEGIAPLIRHGGYDSFPSGHVTFFFALGVALFLSARRPFFGKTSGVEREPRTLQQRAGRRETPDVEEKNGLVNRLLGTLFMVAALLMGLARVAAGIHWPIDVLGGIILGCGMALLAQGSGDFKTEHQQT